MITPRRTILVRIRNGQVDPDGERVEFIAIPEQGAWYEQVEIGYGRYAPIGQVGHLMFPMLPDGKPALGDLTEISEPHPSNRTR